MNMWGLLLLLLSLTGCASSALADALPEPQVVVEKPIHVISSNNQAWGDSKDYVSSKRTGNNSYRNFDPTLTVEFDFTIARLSNWGQFQLVIDKRPTNTGLQLRLLGNDAVWLNSGQQLDVERYALCLYRAAGADWRYVAGAPFETLQFNTEYTLRLERTVGETEVTAKVWLVEKGAEMGAPLVTYSESKENWPAYPGVRFSSWDVADVTVQALRLYNQPLPYDASLSAGQEQEKDEEVRVFATPARQAYQDDEEWFVHQQEMPEYSHSFAVIGDTQTIARYHPNYLGFIYDWIVENAQERKIAYVMGLGDITDGDRHKEWQAAQFFINRLQGVTPFSLCRGNHDSSNQINTYFHTEAYVSSCGGSFVPDRIENTWRTITAGGIDYLIMVLDFAPTDEMVAWANEVITAHPSHNVIIATHAYLDADGTTLDNDGNISEHLNDGQDLWEKLVSKHENIVLVLSGHICSEDIVTTQSVGEHGNVVTQMLINPQDMDMNRGPLGMIAMLYFSADGTQVTVEYFSAVRGQHFREENQFSIQIPVIR